MTISDHERTLQESLDGALEQAVELRNIARCGDHAHWQYIDVIQYIHQAINASQSITIHTGDD